MVIKKWLLSFTKITLVTALCGGAFLWGMALYVTSNYTVDFSVLERYDPGKPTLLLDDEGNEWARFQLDRRQPVPYSQFPQHLINAFVAAEDWKFFKHSGISFKGIIRSTVVNISRGGIVQGASTITQQLVKLLFFDSKRTFKRKLHEQFYSLLVEQQFTKQQILETYLNHVYFGHGIYGVEAAAQRFWGISTSELSLVQSALLAGMVRSPGRYSPIRCPLSAQERRNVVLNQMRKCLYITQAQYEALRAQQLCLLDVKDQEAHQFAPHARETIRGYVEALFGKQRVYAGGLRIKTTLNRRAQKHAQEVFATQIERLKREIGQVIEGAFISIDVKTGMIRALVGGASFSQSQFNRALQARRQQGSVFKPFVYATALQKGISFLDTAVDEPFVMQQGAELWQPKNYNSKFEGSMTLASALSYSNNIITIKTLLAVGAQSVVDLAQRCHIKGPLLPYPSLALGCVDSTAVEVAGMFNVFANNGEFVQPHLIEWVKDRWGVKIYKAEPIREHVMEPRIAHQVAQVLGFGFDRYKKRVDGKWIDSDAIGKTGTTNDSRTCWFAGSTPELTTVAYVGYDDNRSMGQDVFPLYTAYPIWLDYHKGIPTNTKQFSHDSSLTRVFADIQTGKIVSECSGSQVFALLV